MRLESGMKMIIRGPRFRVGMSLAFGLIVTSAALGHGPLFPGELNAVGESPRSIAIGDLNGDQVPDMVTANPYEATVSVLLGVGDGRFADAVDYAAVIDPVLISQISLSVAIGDLDGDLVPDLAVANGLYGNVGVLLGVGDGTFSTVVEYETSGKQLGGSVSVAIGDLNGDQMPDLAVVNSNADASISVLMGVGGGSFAAPVNYAIGDSPRFVAIGDLNGDQVPDLVVANRVSDNVAVLLGAGDGTFAAPVYFPAGDGPASIAIGDLDGDQVPDLAVANNTSDDVSVLLGVGDGTFSASVPYATGISPRSVAIGDLDGDQLLDLAVANVGGDVSVLLGVGNGTFSDAANYLAGKSPFSIAIGDLDGDQVPDLAIANASSDSASVLLGIGDGTFAAALYFPVGDEPLSVAIGDLDGDQVPDLAVANNFGAIVSVMMGVGDGAFGAAVNYAGAGTIRAKSIAIADLNGDQRPDLVVARQHSGGSPEISVLLGLGGGLFAFPVNYDADESPNSVAIGDLNGDQVPDLAVANLDSGNVSVLLGVGNGTFAAAVNYAAGDGPRSVAIGDLDGDQVLDLAVANGGTFPEENESVSVLLGVGDGTFAAAVNYAAGDGPQSVAIGDLDGDLVPDLALANITSDDISVLLGVGDGTFAAATNYPAGDRPRSVVIGDLNGDQLPDLAVTNRDIDNVSVLLGIGDGIFAAAVRFAGGNGPYGLAIGDLDGDHDLDLVTVNGLGDSASVLLNQSGGCNGNGIPDECDIDCGPPGGSCDLPGCGLSVDCDGNGFPDECDAGSSATSVVAPAFAAAPHDGMKHRYLSIDPNNGGARIALQVTLSDGRVCWVGQPALLSDTNGVDPQWVAECVSSPAGDGSDMVRGWYFYTDPSTCLPVVHVRGCVVIPNETYEIRAMTSGGTFTDPTFIATVPTPTIGSGSWGDCVGEFLTGPGVWDYPNSVTNFLDILASIQGFQQAGTAPVTWIDLVGVDPQANYTLNFADISAIISGFQGDPYWDSITGVSDITDCTIP